MEKSKEEKTMQIKEKLVELSEKLDDENLDNEGRNQMYQDYTLLQIEEDDALNGTDNLIIKKKELEIENLKFEKEKSGLIKKIKYIQRINKAEKELKELKSNNKR